jgi:hypothetical protein
MESETPIFSPLEDEMSTPQLAATTAAMWVGVQVPKEIDPGTSIIKTRSQSLCRRKPAFKLQSFFFFFVFSVVWASSHSENTSKIFLRFLDLLQGFSHLFSVYFLFSSIFSLFFFWCRWFFSAFCERYQWQGVTQLVEGSSTGMQRLE